VKREKEDTKVFMSDSGGEMPYLAGLGRAQRTTTNDNGGNVAFEMRCVAIVS